MKVTTKANNEFFTEANIIADTEIENIYCEISSFEEYEEEIKLAIDNGEYVFAAGMLALINQVK